MSFEVRRRRRSCAITELSVPKVTFSGSSTMRFFMLPWIAAGGILPFLTLPQDTQPPKSGQDPNPAVERGTTIKSTELGDVILATWLAVDGDNEIALSRIAEQKAEDPEIKQFARMIIEDHREMGRKLGAFTGLDDQAKPRNASARLDGSFDHLALIHDLGAQCQTSARQELESKS